jgi:hypothetical protein
MKFLPRLVLTLSLLLPSAAWAQDTCTYFGGYPWRPKGCLTSTDLNTAIANALAPPTSLATGVAAANLGSAVGDVNGTWNSTHVNALQGFPVANTTPTDGQLLTWKSLNNRWEPSALGGAGGDISGTFGSAQVTGLQARAVAATAPTTNQALAWNGSQWAPATVVGLGATPGAYGTALVSTGVGNAPDFKPVHGGGTLWAPPGTTAFGPSSLAWIAAQPDGTAISCASTVTNCTQEFLNAVIPKAGADFYGGGGATGSNANPSIGAVALAIPVLRNTYVRMHGGAWYQTGTPAVGTPFVTFDSMVEASFVGEGSQIAGATTTSAPGGVASGSMPAILFDPHTVLPFEAFIGIAASRIDLGNVTVQWMVGQSDSVVKALLTHGGITQSHISALEINGGGPSSTATGAQYGFFITAPVGGNAYYGNLNSLGYIHLVSLAGLQEGLSKTEGANIIGNVYDINNIEPRGAASRGISTWAQASTYRVGNISDAVGQLNTCLEVQAGVSDSVYDIGCRTNATVAVGVAFLTDGTSPASNNSARLRVSGPGTITALVKDAGLNNVAWRGATAYSASGIKVVSVDAAGAQAGGTIVQGTLISVGTGAAQGGLVIGPTPDSHGNTSTILQFGTAANIFIAGGGTTDGVTSDFSLYYHAQTGGAHIFTLASSTILTISAGGIFPGADATDGIGSPSLRFTNLYLSGSIISGDSALILTVPFSKTSDTALANVTGLGHILAAGGRYSCRGHLSVTNGSSGGIKVTLGASAGMTVSNFSQTVRVFNGTTVQANGTNTALGTAAIAITALATDVFIDAGVEVNASGNITVQVAQNVSDATPLTILRDSTFQCWRGLV